MCTDRSEPDKPLTSILGYIKIRAYDVAIFAGSTMQQCMKNIQFVD